MKYIIALALLLTFTGLASAQDSSQIEYGKTADLKGLMKIFVDTGGDIDNRGLILKEFEKSKLKDIVLLDSRQNAEVILQFAGGKETRPIGRTTERRSFGKGIAYIPKPPDIMRIIVSVDDTKETGLDKKPSVKFARAFIKAYKEANGL